MRIGMLTGGGDCPGLNPAIRGCVVRSLDFGNECIGFLEGWKGIYEGNTINIGLKEVEEIIYQGGTILGTSRFNLVKREDGIKKIKQNMDKYKIDALVAMGGEDTLGVAAKIYQEGIKVVGVPKTIDNDLSATDFTFGFDTAVTRNIDACRALMDTGKSHRRIMVLEVMGRHAGWIALYTSIAAGADWCIIPEFENDYNKMYQHLKEVYKRKKYGLVIISEGIDIPEDTSAQTTDDFGHIIVTKRGTDEKIAKMIEKNTEIETRSSVIGHMQRGGSPTVFDRILGVRVGAKAAELVNNGDFGKMACLRGNKIEAVELKEAVARLKTVDREWFEFMKIFFK
jgi:6-phosphofructokinase 1